MANQDDTRLIVYSHGQPLYRTSWASLKATYPKLLVEADFECFLSSGCDHRIYLDGDAYVAIDTEN